MQTSIIAAFTLFASAAFGLSIRQNVPTCAATCFGTLTKNSLSSFNCNGSDFACLCKQDAFINSAAQCFAQICDGADAAAGLVYGENLCKSVGVNVNIPAYASSVVAADTLTTVTGTQSVPPPPSATSAPATTTLTSAPASTSTSKGSTSGSQKNLVSGLAIGAVTLVGVLMF